MRRRSLPIAVAAILLLAGHLAAQGAPPSRAEMRIAFDEFKKLYDRGEVLVLDVRSAESYRKGHIPGAVSVPLDDVEAKIPELKKEKRAIVTYCT